MSACGRLEKRTGSSKPLHNHHDGQQRHNNVCCSADMLVNLVAISCPQFAPSRARFTMCPTVPTLTTFLIFLLCAVAVSVLVEVTFRTLRHYDSESAEPTR